MKSFGGFLIAVAAGAALLWNARIDLPAAAFQGAAERSEERELDDGLAARLAEALNRRRSLPPVAPVFWSIPDEAALPKEAVPARLLGVFISGPRRVALVQIKGETRLLPPGGQAGGLTVTAIGDGWIKCRRNGEAFTLRLEKGGR